jgi:hypothetical protein
VETLPLAARESRLLFLRESEILDMSKDVGRENFEIKNEQNIYNRVPYQHLMAQPALCAHVTHMM